MNETTIVMTWPDHAHLTAMVQARQNSSNVFDAKAFRRLAAELARARLVAAEDIPEHVVTMDTQATVRDLDSDEVFAFTLSWPEEADAARDRINVLAPLGMALLGCRVGQQIEWPVPGGVRRLRVEKVLFQPEHASATEAG